MSLSAWIPFPATLHDPFSLLPNPSMFTSNFPLFPSKLYRHCMQHIPRCTCYLQLLQTHWRTRLSFFLFSRNHTKLSIPYSQLICFRKLYSNNIEFFDSVSTHASQLYFEWIATQHYPHITWHATSHTQCVWSFSIHTFLVVVRRRFSFIYYTSSLPLHLNILRACWQHLADHSRVHISSNLSLPFFKLAPNLY